MTEPARCPQCGIGHPAPEWPVDPECGKRHEPGELCCTAADAEEPPADYDRLWVNGRPLDDDPEINAIRVITGLLQGLDEATRPRVLRYLASRFDPHRDCPF